MPVSKRSNRSLPALLALAVIAISLLLAGQASAATISNACVNNASANEASSLPVSMTAKTSTPGPVKAGDSITLEEIKQELAVPASLFLTGYRLKLLEPGLNQIPTKVQTLIRGTNTAQETQFTNLVATQAETTITDPTPGNRGSGDESATPGTVSAEYENQTWTAGASGPINFREATVIDPTRPNPPGFSIKQGGILIESNVGITVNFGCDPGEVEEAAEPSTIKLITSPAFATLVNEDAANRAPTANAGPDQEVASKAGKVKLNGFESSDSSEESFALNYEWKQTGGPSVTLSGADTMTPSFAAPEGPTSLTFELVKVCDNGEPQLCSSSGDSVTINVKPAVVAADAGPDQTVESGTSVTLDGSGSSAPKVGETLTYEWTQVAGTSVTLSDSKAVKPTFTAPAGPATLEFKLRVCEAKLSTSCATDSVVIAVKAPAAGPGPAPGPENTAPNTKLKSAKIKKHKATFKFSSSEAGSTFLCKLDKKKFSKCKSPKTYKNLKPGKHKFQVKARDSQGKLDPTPVVKKFKIKK